MDRLTVYHIDPERSFRGAESQLLFLAEALRAKGHENVIVCRAGELLDREAARRRFDHLHLPFLADWDPVSAWKLRRHAAGRARVLLHAHTDSAAGVAGMAAEGARLPRVVHRRTDFGGAEALDYLLKYRRADRVIAVSESIRRQLVDFGLPEELVRMVHEGYPAASARKSPRTPQDVAAARNGLALDLDVPALSLWIGTAASLTPHHDHAGLLKAFQAVLRGFPESYLLIAGEGPRFEELRREAQELGVLDRTRFLGQPADETAFVGSLDVLVFPPLTMGLGYTLLEAQAQAVPVVTTWVGGVTEIVEHGVNGLLAPPGDPAKLAAAVERVLEHPDLARSLAAAGLERMKAFTVESMAAKTEAVYRELAPD